MSPKKEKLILLAIGIVILAAIAGMGYWIWAKFKPAQEENKISIANLTEEPKKEGSVQEEPASSAGEESTSPAAEEKAVAPAEINVKVLNGGAAAGMAGKIKNTLAAKGYAKTEAANANLSGYTGVIIYYQAAFAEQAQSVREILKPSYSAIEIKEGINTKEPSGDMVVILGR